MSELDKKPTLGRKIFIASAISLVLVVLPAISWIYLQDGLNWRKKAVGELGTYGQIPSAIIHWPDGTQEDRLKSKVVVVYHFSPQPDLTPENKKILDEGQKIFDQFGKNPQFVFAMIAENGTTEFRSYTQKLPGSDYANWVWVPGEGNWAGVLKNGFELYNVKNDIDPYPRYYALADTAGVIRRFYDATDDKEVGRMVEQVAILLPQQ